MRIKQFKIKNYRSFVDDQEILLSDINTLIGPNNAGKSNLLQAIKLFFDAFEGAQNYHYSRDFPRDAPPGRTSTTTVFSLDVTNEDDDEIWNRYDRLRRKMKLPSTIIKDIPINLQFSVGDKPTYSLFPGTSIPPLLRTSDDFQNWHQELINEILQKFNVSYIPAEKELKHLFKDIVVWVLKREIADHVKQFMDEVVRQVELVSMEVNQILASIGMGDINVFFEVPPSFEDFATGIDMIISDRNLGGLFEKSMGMQWMIISCCILWVSRSLARQSDIRCVWLIEEPESYLHPELFSGHRRVVDTIGKYSDIIYTTHSLGFVSSDISKVYGIFHEKNQSNIVRFSSYHQAISRIKKGLGVRFSDYFNLRELTVAMEGRSDVEYITWFLKLADQQLEDANSRWPLLMRAEIIGFEGARSLSGFVRANYLFIREEIAFVPVFDGDETGKKETTALRHFLNGREESAPFNANADYVLLPNGFAIEGLFPDSYINEFIRDHPKWFKDKGHDVEDKLVSFSIYDERKATFAQTIKYKGRKGFVQELG